MSSVSLELASPAPAAPGHVAPRRVFHLLDEADPFSERNGGAISRWMANVLRAGQEIVVCPSFDDTWQFDPDRIYVLPRWKDTDPIHPVLYRMGWTLQKLFYLRVFRPLLAMLQPGDVLYVHNRPECAAVLATVAAKHGITVVLHMHNSHLTQASRGQLKALRNTPIVFCSEFLRQEIDRRLPGQFRDTSIVYNGADGSKFRPTQRFAKAAPTIIFTGRLVPDKGAHILLQAMALLEQRGVAARCEIVGGVGFGKERTSRYLRELKRMCPSNTALLGYKTGSALAERIAEADIFCCPSVWNDPFPLSPIEGLACGLPVVASRAGGIPEALAYGGGVLVPPNDPIALADALQTLAGDFAYRQRLGEEALAAFHEHFLWEDVRAQYTSFLEGLAA